MKEITILSGKGGTGKTSITAAIASVAKDSIIVDSDVDAPDLHLIFQPLIREQHIFKSGHKAVIRKDECIECGQCVELCFSEAISDDFVVDPFECEGCKVCVTFCPAQCIDFPESTSGEWYLSHTRVGPMVHARLFVGEENSGLLVAEVRKKARELAEAEGFKYIITDGPPGVGCPVISSLTGSNFVLLVTEPTLSAWNDLLRVKELTDHFKIPVLICLNKSDINKNISNRLKDMCKERGMEIVAEIPYREEFLWAIKEQKSIMEYGDVNELLDIKSIFRDLWQEITYRLSI